MGNHEKLVTTGKQLSRRVWLRQNLRVVSELTLGDVTSAESFVHKAHGAQIHDGEETALANLRNIVGKPVDTFKRSGPIDLASWGEDKVGEYHRSSDGSTFAYSKMVNLRNENVIETVAFTNLPRSVVIENLGNQSDQGGENIKHLPNQIKKEAA